MDELMMFFNAHGYSLTAIAIAGIVILGIMKYCNLFKRLSEQTRHPLYILISCLLSIVGSTIYLFVQKSFDFKYLATVSVMLYMLNQTFYNIFKVLTLKELFERLISFLLQKYKK